MSGGESSIGKWISVLYRCRMSYLGRTLEPYGISGGQSLFLLTLYFNNGESQEKISSCLKIDKTTTARAVKRLEDGGFVTRSVDISDKRAYKVFLTQKALGVVPHIHEALKRWEDLIKSEVTDDEYILLEKLLNKIADKAYGLGNP